MKKLKRIALQALIIFLKREKKSNLQKKKTRHFCTGSLPSFLIRFFQRSVTFFCLAGVVSFSIYVEYFLNKFQIGHKRR